MRNAKFAGASQICRAFSVLFVDSEFLTSTESEEEPN